MSYLLADSLQRELGLAQSLFDYAKQYFTDPLRQLSGLLSQDWLCAPSQANQSLIVTVLETCLPNLEQPFDQKYISVDPRHLPFQQLQWTLHDLCTSHHSATLNNYFNLAHGLLGVMVAMDSAYKASISHVDELEHAKLIARSAEEKAKSLGVKVVIAILDKSTQLVLLHRMHGSMLIGTDVAMEKARSAVLMQMPTGDILPLIQAGAEFEGLQYSKSGLCILKGGLSMFAGMRLIGGIGISGSTAKLDVEIGQYAVRENYLSIYPETVAP